MGTIISGTFIGTAGTGGMAAGTGLQLPSITPNYTITSAGTAVGGAGYNFPDFSGLYTSGHPGGAGAIGVDMAGGRLTNFGLISGGKGGNGASYQNVFYDEPGGAGGIGGTGLRVAGFGTLNNHGSISGGQGGSGGIFNAVAGIGGMGVDLANGGMVINAGRISGGTGGSAAAQTYLTTTDYAGPAATGGTGVFFAKANSTLENMGTVSGGAGGYGFFDRYNDRYGSPSGDGGTGVELQAGGLVFNKALVSGGAGASSSSLDTPAGSGGTGIILDTSGAVYNYVTVSGGSGGAETGGGGGIGIDAVLSGAVYNYGLITGGDGGSGAVGAASFNGAGPGGAGVVLGTGQMLNLGTIRGGSGGVDGVNGVKGGDGVDFGGGAKIAVNLGLIAGGAEGTGFFSGGDGGGIGVDIAQKGLFINAGTIIGGTYAVGMTLAGGSTLANIGTIIGDAGAVTFGAAGLSRLMVTAAARFSGGVLAGGSGNVLEIGGTKIGTLEQDGGAFHGFGSTLSGFQTLQVDSHSTWAISGTLSSVVNNGVIEVAAGKKLAVITANPSGPGTFLLTGGSDLMVTNVLGAGPKFDFIGSSDELVLEKPGSFGTNIGLPSYKGPLLEAFGPGDMVDLASITSSGLKLNYNTASGVLQVTASSGTAIASLQFQAASLGAGSFHVASDNAGGSLITHS